MNPPRGIWVIRVEAATIYNYVLWISFGHPLRVHEYPRDLSNTGRPSHDRLAALSVSCGHPLNVTIYEDRLPTFDGPFAHCLL